MLQDYSFIVTVNLTCTGWVWVAIGECVGFVFCLIGFISAVKLLRFRQRRNAAAGDQETPHIPPTIGRSEESGNGGINGGMPNGSVAENEPLLPPTVPYTSYTSPADGLAPMRAQTAGNSISNHLINEPVGHVTGLSLISTSFSNSSGSAPSASNNINKQDELKPSSNPSFNASSCNT